MRQFILFIVLFIIFPVLPSGADDILVKEKDAEPTVHASDVFVYSTDKDSQGNIRRIDYVSWNAKDMSIKYNTVYNGSSDNKTYSVRESEQEKKQKILQMLSEKGVSAGIFHGLSKITMLRCLMLDYSLPGYIVLGKSLPDDTYISLIESSGTVHLFPFKVVDSLVHSGKGNVVVRLTCGNEYKGIWERRAYGSTGHAWTFDLQGLTEKGEFRAFSLSDISSIKFTTFKEPVKVSAHTSDELTVLSEKIKKSVTELEYSDKIAEDFVKMLMNWKDTQDQPVLIAWKQRLNRARQDYEQGKISNARLAKEEETIVKELSQRIKKEISYSEGFFDLADVIKHRQSNCCGYTQLVYISGNSIGLSVKATSVLELMAGVLPTGVGHVACMVSLADAKTIMIDSVPGGFVSNSFRVEEEFGKVGNYREIKDKDNPLRIHRKIQILDRNGLLAGMHHLRGIVYRNLGQHTKAISHYTKAIELNPKYAEAYCNRGVSYVALGESTKAISDYTKAVELNPKDAEVYNNRGVAYDGLGEHTEAISDYTKAIELNPKLASAYNNRGMAYSDLGQPTKAISDHTKVIELNPKHAKSYYSRGNAYYNSGQFNKAISDFNRGIDLSPKDAKLYLKRGIVYAYLKSLEDAKRDLFRAVELDPSLKTNVKKISELFKLELQLD